MNSHSQDFVDPCEIFLSGSTSNMLSGELATLLSGRYVEFEVFPYNFREFCAARGGLQASRENYLHFLQEGGLPELLRLNDEEIRRHYVASLKGTVMLRDIVVRYRNFLYSVYSVRSFCGFCAFFSLLEHAPIPCFPWFLLGIFEP